jgi:23S rRNA (adenine1618-N6)-methyltransferase
VDSSTNGNPLIQGMLHPRNPHAGRYNFEALCESRPELRPHLRPNPAGDQTIDFSDREAVLCLNRALLTHCYRVQHWQIPAGYLCPAIPGRADAIHYLADLLAIAHKGKVPTGKNVNVLDVGTGANCIYPIIGSQSYGWRFVGTDIDSVAINTARVIVEANPGLKKKVKIVQQTDPTSIFRGIIQMNDRFDLTMCNPPFHASLEEAQASSQRKERNLDQSKGGKTPAQLNFGGQNAELWCRGGEMQFLTGMINESLDFATQVRWFTSLVSKGESLPLLVKSLERVGAKKTEIINMSQGQKRSRLLAWSFAKA